MLMKPSPRAETSRLLFPSVRFCIIVFLRCLIFLLWSEFAEPISRRYSAIHEEVAAGDERAVCTHEKCADSSYFVGSASSSSRARFHHVPVARAARPF